MRIELGKLQSCPRLTLLRNATLCATVGTLLALQSLSSPAIAQLPFAPGPSSPLEADEEGWLSRDELRERVLNTLPIPEEARALHPSNRIWIDRKDKVVILDGYIAQQAAMLEMFACPIGTKEHESVVAVFASSQLVHAGLLAVGAKPGKPASFDPFKPASGATVRIYALWYDTKGKKQVTIAQKWVRQMGSKDNLEFDWVFAGSREYLDEYTNERKYAADHGELVCVANFGTSTLDLVVRSEQDNANLAFEAYSERVPKRNTPVRLVMLPVEDAPTGKATAADKETDDAKDSAESPDSTKKTPEFLTAPIPDFVQKYLIEKDEKSDQ